MSSRAERRLEREKLKAELLGKTLEAVKEGLAFGKSVLTSAAGTNTGGVFLIWGAARLGAALVGDPEERKALEGTINDLAFAGIVLPPVAGAASNIIPGIIARGK